MKVRIKKALLGTGDWELETGYWVLVTGYWELETVNWELGCDQQAEYFRREKSSVRRIKVFHTALPVYFCLTKKTLIFKNSIKWKTYLKNDLPTSR
jgi:hypothetical protein